MRKGYRIDPLNGGILKNMLLFAIPTTLTALLQMFFSAADTVILGRFGHENAISAIGVSASLLNMLVGGMVSLSSGVVAVVGRISGRGDKEIGSEYSADHSTNRHGAVCFHDLFLR